MSYYVIAFLFRKFGKVNTSTIDSHRGTCFHTLRLEAERHQLFCQAIACVFSYSSTRECFLSNVYGTIKESAISKYDTFGIHVTAHGSMNASDHITRHHQSIHMILPEVEVWSILQYMSPQSRELRLITLNSGAPHRRAFGFIQHTELYHSLISHNTHLSAQGIDLSNNLSLCDTANSRVTRHGSHKVHIHSHQQCLIAKIRSSCCSFTTCMSCTYNNYIILFKKHGFT